MAERPSCSARRDASSRPGCRNRRTCTLGACLDVKVRCRIMNSFGALDAGTWIDHYLNDLARAPSSRMRDSPRTALATLLSRHGDPQRGLRVVRIAGSKGKGSTALMLEAMLTQAGWRTGAFVSPHIEHWCERIRVAGGPVPADEFAAVLAELAPDVAALRRRPGSGPDFFEVCLVAALLIFVRRGLDVVIVEAGIGAATDATAVLDAGLAVLTTVEPEHLQVIGPELGDVAREKAGVLAADRTAIIGRLPPVAAREVELRRQAIGARLLWLGQDFHVERDARPSSGQLRYFEPDYELPLTLAPALYWLADNLALAVAAARRIPDITVDERNIANALIDLRLPGRLEHLGDAPIFLADGAHTPASSVLLARMLSEYDVRPRILVVAFSAGHGPDALSPGLWGLADGIVVTQADAARGRDPNDIAGEIEALHCAAAPVHVEVDPTTALRGAARLAGRNGLVCATGSVHLVGRTRAYARERGWSEPEDQSSKQRAGLSGRRGAARPCGGAVHRNPDIPGDGSAQHDVAWVHALRKELSQVDKHHTESESQGAPDGCN
ncbi:Dihydrofolate synthase, Folylpolyglutamate synthase [Salinisphaera sp. LB1]|nr:Dihydrofolate synthase, Folylpolyglutamate synthase [Salinisphaera sp. LB1]